MTRSMRVAFGIGATCGDCRWFGGCDCATEGRLDPSTRACVLYEREDPGGDEAADRHLASEHALWGRTCDSCRLLCDRVRDPEPGRRVGLCRDTGLACLSGEYCSGWRRRVGEGR